LEPFLDGYQRAAGTHDLDPDLVAFLLLRRNLDDLVDWLGAMVANDRPDEQQRGDLDGCGDACRAGQRWRHASSRPASCRRGGSDPARDGDSCRSLRAQQRARLAGPPDIVDWQRWRSGIAPPRAVDPTTRGRPQDSVRALGEEAEQQARDRQELERRALSHDDRAVRLTSSGKVDRARRTGATATVAAATLAGRNARTAATAEHRCPAAGPDADIGACLLLRRLST
jgi:hypothetical protein